MVVVVLIRMMSHVPWGFPPPGEEGFARAVGGDMGGDPLLLMYVAAGWVLL